MASRYRRSPSERHAIRLGYFFISPWILGFCLFLAFPMAQSLQLSFLKIISVDSMKSRWIGLDNYAKAFFGDVRYLELLGTTYRQILVDTPLIIVFSLFLAVLLNRNLRMKGFFRGIFFLPVLLGTGYIMKQLLGESSYNEQLQSSITLPQSFALFLGPQLGSAVQALLNTLSRVLWRSGVQIIIFLSGLQGVPLSMYEAARCDGASKWEEFWKITLPMLTPVILMNVIYTLIAAFSDGTNPLIDYVVYVVFDKLQFGYGAALGWIFFLLDLAVVLGAFAIINRSVIYQGEK
jgi:ABC-type sugar transport system permease subunit